MIQELKSNAIPEPVPIMPVEEAVKVFQSLAAILKVRIETQDYNGRVSDETIKMKSEELSLYRALVIRFMHESIIVKIEEPKRNHE